jgi:hypothetical protein
MLGEGDLHVGFTLQQLLISARLKNSENYKYVFIYSFSLAVAELLAIL